MVCSDIFPEIGVKLKISEMQFDTLKDILILLHTTGNNQQMMLLQRKTRRGDCYEWRHDDPFARLVLNTFLTTREKWSHLTATAHSLMNWSTFTNHCTARVYSSLGGEHSSDQVDVVDLHNSAVRLSHSSGGPPNG